MIELERTFLAKKIPHNLQECKYRKIIDIYIPKERKHPSLRIRRNGDKYRLTKKEPVKRGDKSKMLEQTIFLTESEYNILSKTKGKKVEKMRYQYKYENVVAEIDVFQGDLKGLVLVDFEFKTVAEKNKFKMPNFCLVEVTSEKFVAGGMLCGKGYEDIEEELRVFKYKKLL